jgi:hypothetical protein
MTAPDEVLDAIELAVNSVLIHPAIVDYIMTRLTGDLPFQWIGTFSSDQMKPSQIKGALVPIFHARFPAGFIYNDTAYIYLRRLGQLLAFRPDSMIVEFFQSKVPDLDVEDLTVPSDHWHEVWPLYFIYSEAHLGRFDTDPESLEQFLLSLLRTFPNNFTAYVESRLTDIFEQIPVYFYLSERFDLEGVDLLNTPELQ